ncbi:MAG: glycosyltransferase [Thermoplasmata archaeon]|nr:glycosyltransferase [Thermoplasmata archaeon]
MRILYGICTWGLGHASRSMPVIRRLVADGHEVHVVTSGPARSMVKRECDGVKAIHDIPDYPSPYTGNRMTFYIKFLTTLPGLFKGIEREHEAVMALHRRRKFDRVISDNRYGVNLPNVPSFLISHQLRFLAPRRIATFERRSERFVAGFADRFEGFIVPDEAKGDLTGELSHGMRLIPPKQIHYVGILTDFKAVEAAEDIDLLVSISGPEPQRTRFESLVMEQLPMAGKRIVVSRGVSDVKGGRPVKRKGVEVFDYMPAGERAEHLSRSKVVVTRSGYSTLMDLAAMGKHALLVPTPGQTEQEYLARKHMAERHWAWQDQRKVDLKRGFSKAMALIPPLMSAERSVDRVLEVVGV